MYRLLPGWLWLLLLWGVLIAVSLYVRPLFPIDETRYAAVAWEMWLRNDFLVPYLNGEVYSHKPPLLFWLMQLSWRLFGVNDWSLRLISPLFSLATLFLSGAVARTLWPERKRIEALTPLLLLGLSFWLVYSTLTMFDMMLAFFALLGVYSLLKLAESRLSLKYWALLGIAIGGGALSKGPVILLHILPVALLGPWWLKTTGFRWKHWYLALVSAVLIGAAIALCWAIPAGIAGGEDYRKAIFLGQTSGRLVESFAHRLPWWWYLEILPLLLLPWLLWKPLWVGLRKLTHQDSGIRFCLVWAIPVFIAFSLISGKRIHYLLPLIPALALILARAVDELTEPERWQRGHIIVMAVFGLLGVVFMLLPWIKGVYPRQSELSLISPMWGGLLVISAVVLAVIRAKELQDSVLYICVASVIALTTVSGGIFSVKADRYDTKIAARTIAALMDQNRAVAFYGSKYHGQYQFAGRLKQPITVIPGFAELYAWAKQHQTGYIIVTYSDAEALSPSLISYHYPFRGQNVGLLSCRVLLANSASVPF
ncbi:4-amino-4-deoxy-L-arabinose transferase-like glycosyltransferase [Methylobacter tundripaludum]|uniref:4-amino-4-deoxy-L-arabinose transferase-like glycosyltransferase n=1 Tax=Methylobacter tundripaludum TaxID=173365 RepID=A0A2S6GXQ8_9GAMM|nr:glycosyltransferase family 39 protein [Methylobacter tundripaludum]PPK69950.1 4-amino-4-deoxy-L-arabinose transferase-like glycosyltransferase [Methylobacter tundripaludum]